MYERLEHICEFARILHKSMLGNELPATGSKHANITKKSSSGDLSVTLIVYSKGSGLGLDFHGNVENLRIANLSK